MGIAPMLLSDVARLVPEIHIPEGQPTEPGSVQPHVEEDVHGPWCLRQR